MRPVFLSADQRMRESWCAAFPDLVIGGFGSIPAGAGVIWLLLPVGQGVEAMVAGSTALRDHRPFVVLSDTPSEEEALAALTLGASGYCNGHAAPQVLQQVASVIENGGVWVGQGLMQRLLVATSRLAIPNESDSWRKVLTAREQETAQLLAKGGSNKEIARQLDITERTVKAHVGAMLEKLGARDRLQLSLIINGIEKPR